MLGWRCPYNWRFARYVPSRTVPGIWRRNFQIPQMTFSLRVRATFADSSVEDVTHLCTFESGDPSIIQVNRDGVVATQSIGDSTIIVRYRSTPAIARVFVPGPPAGEFPLVAEASFVDSFIVEKLKRLNIQPSPLVADAVFLRRVSLQVTGALPEPDEIRAFLANNDPDKRAQKIDELLERPGYAALWAMKFCDLLKPEFKKEDLRFLREPAYARRFYEWIRARLLENTPYDVMVERMLLATSAEGRSHEEVYGELKSLAEEDVAYDTRLEAYAKRRTLDLFWLRTDLTGVPGAIQTSHALLGLRMECAQCHRHPSDVWQQDDLLSFANFFTRMTKVNRYDKELALQLKEAEEEVKKLNEQASKIRQQATKLRSEANQKRSQQPEEADQLTAQASELMVQAEKLKTEAEVQQRYSYLRYHFTDLRHSPEGRTVNIDTPLGRFESKTFRLLGEDKNLEIPKEQDPREILMNWLRQPDNPFFAKAIVNRVWAHYFDRGIVDPPDDLSPLNPPSHSELQAALVEGFIEHKYDLKWLHRTILNSHTYQRSAQTNDTNVSDRRNFSHFLPRRLRAEVLVDAVNHATGGRHQFPDIAYLPPDAKAIEVPAMTHFHIDNSGRYTKASLDFAFETFGRSKRDLESQCDCDVQRDASLTQGLYLAAYEDVLQKIALPEGQAARILAAHEDDASRIEEAFLRVLARPPSAAERKIFMEHFQNSESSAKAMEDLFWVLLNTHEFVINQ
jgi:hypothetical protein